VVIDLVFQAFAEFTIQVSMCVYLVVYGVFFCPDDILPWLNAYPFSILHSSFLKLFFLVSTGFLDYLTSLNVHVQGLDEH